MSVKAMRYFGYRKEKDPSLNPYGTEDTAEPINYTPFDNENLGLTIEPIEEKGMAGRVDAGVTEEGLGTVGGAMKLNGRVSNIKAFLDIALGLDTGGVWTPPQEGVGLPQIYPYTFYFQKGLTGDSVFRNIGCAAQSVEFAIGTDAKMMEINAEIIAKDQDLIADPVVAPPPSPMSSDKPFFWHEAVITIGTSTAENIEKFACKITNSLEGVSAINSSKRIRTLKRGDGRRYFDVMATFDIEDTVEWLNFKDFIKQPLNIMFTKGATSFEIDMPLFVYRTFPLNAANAGRLSIGVAGRADFDEASGYAAEFTLVD